MSRLKDKLWLVGIAIALFAIWFSVRMFPWLLLLPVAAAVLAYPVYILRRALSLRSNGYFVRRTRKQPVMIIYEERREGQVVFLAIPTANIDVARDDVIVPTRAEWLLSSPEWARNRRDEIFTRIVKARPKGWAKLPDDWTA
jgi:hypothetical protein